MKRAEWPQSDRRWHPTKDDLTSHENKFSKLSGSTALDGVEWGRDTLSRQFGNEKSVLLDLIDMEYWNDLNDLNDNGGLDYYAQYRFKNWTNVE